MPRSRPPLAVGHAAAFSILLAAAGPAAASVYHQVFGLDPTLAYCVRCGSEVIISCASPGPSGDLAFVAPACAPIAVTPVAKPMDAPAGVGDGTPEAVQIVGPYPNPSDGAFGVEVTVNLPGRVRVALYELSGRLVAILHEGMLSGGGHTFSYRDNRAGVPRLASSVYLVRVEAGGGGLTKKEIVRR
jgi:hypothetical protein